MKVQADKALQNEIQKLNRMQKHHIAAKKGEIESVDKLYEQKVIDAKAQGEENLLLTYDRNEENLIQANKVREEKLQAIDKQINQQKSMMDKQLKDLTSQHQARLENTNNVFDHRYKRQLFDAKQKALEIDENANDVIKKVHFETDRQIKKINDEAKFRANIASQENNRKLSSKSEEFKRVTRRAELEHANRVAQQELAHTKFLEEEKEKNTLEFLDQKQRHKAQMAFKQNQHLSLLKSEDESFKQKLELMQKNHQEVMDRLKTAFNSEIQGLTQSQSQVKQSIANKGHDDFYRIEKLSPRLVNHLDHYTLSIDVPEHEKENVVVTARDRKVKINLSRRFSDETEDLNGDVNRNNRSEVLTKVMQTPELLNHRDITRKYEEGVLIYKIAKL